MIKSGKSLKAGGTSTLISILDELPLWSAPFGLELLDVVELKRGMNVLDIGSCTGFPAIELAMRLGKSSNVYGLDPWEEANERARHKIFVLGINNIEIINGIAEQMPFNEGMFDLVVSNNGLTNSSEISESIRECGRVTKSGAQLVFAYNLETTMMEFYKIFKDTLMEFRLHKEAEDMLKHIHAKRIPLSAMVTMLEAEGFEIRDIRHRSFGMTFVDSESLFDHYLIRQWFYPSWKKIVKREDENRVFNRIKEKIDHVSTQNGSFSLAVPFAVINCTRS